MENPKFQVFKSTKNGQYYYRLRAANGEIVLSGEGYTSIQSCLKGIASVRINAVNHDRYIKKSEYFDYSFNLRAGNGEIVGRSESYITAAMRDRGMSAVRRYAVFAKVEDLSLVVSD
ncbi:MAG TPA: YegP family protein [Chryseolinea sp.]|nr:YegP family protein [Chryseolinea sp.]